VCSTIGIYPPDFGRPSIVLVLKKKTLNSIMKTSNIGSPLMFSRKEQTKAPTTSSSHTGTTTKGILSRLYKNFTSSILISTPVGPMKTQNVPDVKKPDQLFALRGTVSQPTQQTPSNLMAGAPSPKPLSGAPKPPGGNVPPPIMSGALGGGGGGNAPRPIMSGALGGGAGGGAKPPVQGPLPTPGMIPGVPRSSRVECTNNKCKLTTAPSSAIQGVIRMTVPVDKANHPLLSQIKEVSFIPGTAAATLGVPIKKTRHVIVRRLKNGTRVVIKRLKDGRVVRMPGTIIKQTLPNGQVIEVRKLPDGRTIPVKPVPKAAFAQPIGPGRIFGSKQPVPPPPVSGPKQPVPPPLAVSSTGKPLPPKTVLPPLPGGIYGNKAVSEAVIAPGQQLVSINGRFKAVMQTDGNFVIYKDRTAIWALQSVNVPWYGPGRRAVMQNDGNFVIYDKRGKPVWATGTNNPNRPTRIVMHNRGNLCIYDNIGNRKWCSNTRQPSVNCEGKWSECSKTCGGGQQMYSVTRKADFGGNPCPNKDGDMRPCNRQLCGAPPHLRKGRRIILRRTDGRSEYINVLGIDVFDQNGNRITDNVTASMGPQVYANDPGQFGAQYLIDGVHTERRGRRGSFYRLPHTTNVPNAHMTVNLGSDRLISKIVVWNRTECCSDRIIGCNLRIRNSNNDLLIDHRISQNRPVYTFTFGPKGVIVN
jgi:hypothetical protein